MLAPSSFSLPHGDDGGTLMLVDEEPTWVWGMALYLRQVLVPARIPKILQFVAEQSDGYVRGFVRREKNELTRCPHLSVSNCKLWCGEGKMGRLAGQFCEKWASTRRIWPMAPNGIFVFLFISVFIFSTKF
jgi:hypothetical protein